MLHENQHFLHIVALCNFNFIIIYDLFLLYKYLNIYEGIRVRTIHYAIQHVKISL